MVELYLHTPMSPHRGAKLSTGTTLFLAFMLSDDAYIPDTFMATCLQNLHFGTLNMSTLCTEVRLGGSIQQTELRIIFI